MKQILLTLTAIFLIATFSIAQNIPSYVPTNGLVAYYPFNGNYNDYSSNAYNGTANGSVPFIIDRNGNNNSALQLGSGYVTASPNVFQFQFTAAFSISVWFTKESAADGGRLISTECSEGNFRIAAYSTTGNYAVQYGTYLNDLVPLNTWTHLVCTYNNGDFKIYQNGILKNSAIISTSQIQNFCSPFTIGAKAAPAYDKWIGKIDDLGVYNRALTQEEVTQLYTGTEPCAATTSFTNLSIQYTALPYSWNGLTFNAAGSQTAHLTNSCGADSAATLNLTVTNTLPTYLPSNGLVGWWPFNGNANDESGNGNNGTVNGATLTEDRSGNANRSYMFGLNKKIDLGALSILGSNPTNATYSFWIKLNSLPTGNVDAYPVMSRRHVSLYDYDWCTPRVDQSNKLKFFKDDDWYLGQGCQSSILNVGTWYHFVCVKKQDSLFMFQNGQLINTSYDSYYLSGSPQNLIVGWQGAWNWYFDGKIDDIAIYNRALTQEEVTKLYNTCSASSSSEFSAAGCEQYQLPWTENPVTTSGDYLHTYNTADGCDSIVTAHITINHSVAGASFNASGINTYTLPWGDIATQSGYYTHLYQNEFGCDSLVTAYVVINSPADSSSHNIGINVENPQRNLHIKDAIRLEPRNTPLNNPTKGDIYFDGSLNKLRVYDGTTWQNCW